MLGRLGSDVRSDTGQTYQYHQGDSQDDFIKRNAFSKESGYGFTNFLNPVQGFANGIRGKSYYKRQAAEYEDKRRSLLEQLQQRQYGAYQEEQGRLQQQDDQRRRGAIDALDRAFHAPARLAAQNAQYDASLKNQIAGINYDYGRQSQAAGLAALRRGRLGSSFDAETQGGLRSNAQLATLTAQNSVADQRSALAEQDQQQYEALRRALLAGDPQAAMQYQAQAQGIGNTIADINRRSADADRQRELADANRRNNIQLVGGIGNAAATGVYGYYGNPQYGGY